MFDAVRAALFDPGTPGRHIGSYVIQYTLLDNYAGMYTYINMGLSESGSGRLHALPVLSLYLAQLIS